ncbi:uncharacterized protein F4812DRAFT_463726 [Daldinia caldariorum]|uniref:uncharacterized protein n=1 Tax=Daldinia caldariorum TaxID=326644 RepID=UPI002007658C|nr:uncharacterized protein F4812DRAFT_463726 [Daldinia caldariorum]KAI1463390.1 hypothetical protein F4812DRAFT_463726 [Daldinia caldariorum]
MLDTASIIAVILVPIVLIAIMLAMWYCPFRHVSHSHPGEPAPSTATATVESIPLPSETPSYELEAHQSFGLSRISEEGGPRPPLCHYKTVGSEAQRNGFQYF